VEPLVFPGLSIGKSSSLKSLGRGQGFGERRGSRALCLAKAKKTRGEANACEGGLELRSRIGLTRVAGGKDIESDAAWPGHAMAQVRTIKKSCRGIIAMVLHSLGMKVGVTTIKILSLPKAAQ